MKPKTVSIPFELYDAIEGQISELDFKSVDEYVIFILRELLEDDVEENTLPDSAEEEKVKNRLRQLGYL